MADYVEPGATSSGSSVEALLTVLVVLALEERALRVADQPAARRVDVLLVEAGLSIQTVAALLGRKPDAVRMAVRRDRARATRSDPDSS